MKEGKVTNAWNKMYAKLMETILLKCSRTGEVFPLDLWVPLQQKLNFREGGKKIFKLFLAPSWKFNFWCKGTFNDYTFNAIIYGF